MKLGIAMMLIASLSATLLTIPSKVALAQTSQNQTMPGNQTMPANLTKMTRVVIPIDITQLRDQIRSISSAALLL